MLRRTRKAPNLFHHPSSDEVDYRALLEAMRDYPKQVNRLRGLCGLRKPLTGEAEVLIPQIDAVAARTRVPGAEQFVTEAQLGHLTPMDRVSDNQ